MPWPATPPAAAHRAALADAEPRPFWTLASDASPALAGAVDADLCIVGGGFTGLWAALHAKAGAPAREVVLLEAETCGFGASGRNGGFAVASLTHGIENGLARFASEIDVLERLARENFAGLVRDLDAHGIDCDFEPAGELTVWTDAHQLDGHVAALLERFGHDVTVFDAEAMRAEVASPTYLGGVWNRTGAGVLDPGKLAAGLRAAALRAGVRIFEHSAVHDLRAAGAGVEALTAAGRVRARRAVIATSAYKPLVRALRRYIAPVYDYALVTEPLDLAPVGWRRRQGIGDAGNRFHYYRLTPDDRILFGGFDAIYRYGGPVGPRHDEHAATFAKLSQHFFHTFPQLAGTRFTHRWGGAIDTCSRFSVFFGTALGGRAAYAAGYTGLGVAAARFGARVALDLADGRATETTRLRYVRAKPVPFPPEPLRWAGIAFTLNRLAAADRRAGRRGVWLRTLDRLGLGFDS